MPQTPLTLDAETPSLSLGERGKLSSPEELVDALALADEHDVHLPRPVHADRQRLLDVGAAARAGDDRERARQLGPERLEQLRKPRQDAVGLQEGDVDLG